MAGVRQTRTGKWELSIRSKLLPKPVYFTFDNEEDARNHGQQIDAILKTGVVPAELVQDNKPAVEEKLTFVLRAWLNTGKPAKSDVPLLLLLVDEVGKLPLAKFTYAWAEQWVQDMKLVQNFAPGTIRKRVGALARAVDWWMRTHPDVKLANPLKLLPRGASSYTAKDAEDLAKISTADKPLVAKRDVQRDRRLDATELQRIVAALAGEKREDRERALDLTEGPALRMLFWLIYYTGVRLREAYTLQRGQVDLAGKVLRVRSSKQWHGQVKWRTVPIRRELFPLLEDHLASLPDGDDVRVFPWWNGEWTDAGLNPVTWRLSGQFRRLFEYAQCVGLTEHDLRHEATCQWFEMRDPRSGAWMFRESEIEKIMGWAPGSSMASRYASFRGEDLAARMW